jgi:hypothetical protein
VNIINSEEIMNEYLQWLKDTGKAKYELTNIYVNNNGEFKTIKKMAWVVKNTPEDWKEFCKETNKEYEGEIKLLACY